MSQIDLVLTIDILIVRVSFHDDDAPMTRNKTTVKLRNNGSEGTDCIIPLLPKSGIAKMSFVIERKLSFVIVRKT